MSTTPPDLLLQPHRDDTGAGTHLDLGTFVFTRQPSAPSGVIPGGIDQPGWRVDEPGIG